MSTLPNFPDRPLYEKLPLFIFYALKRKDIREFIRRSGFSLFIILWLSITIITGYSYDASTAIIIFIMPIMLSVIAFYSIIMGIILHTIYEEVKDYILNIIKSMECAWNEANYHEE